MRRLLSAFWVVLGALLLAGCPSGTSGDGTGDPPNNPDPNPDTSPYSATGAASDLGFNASLHGAPVFPADNPWNTAVDTADVDPNSDTLIDSIGRGTHFHPDFGANWNGGPFGIPYIVVAGDTSRVDFTFDYWDQSDAGPYPLTSNAPIEGGAQSHGDRHVLIIDRDHWKLFELYNFWPPTKQKPNYTAGSGAIFDLNSNALRPGGWTSADAAGLPIFAGLVRYDEVMEQKVITHALRFTVNNTRHAYISPATHYASDATDASLPPMGMRVRLKANFDISGYPDDAKVILTALKKYGMFVADNGSDWYVTGVADARWIDDDMNTLKQLTGNNFEVVKMGTIVTD